VKLFLYGSVSTLVLTLIAGALIGFAITRLGLIPINADATPSSLEQRVLPAVVRAAVARQAQSLTAIDTDSHEGALAGAEIYKAMCAQCHGQANGRSSVLGSSFYPPAPQLSGHKTAYTDRELFWIVKHGIRNTSMPAWRNLLSDSDIAQVVAFLKTMDSSPVADHGKPTHGDSSGDRAAGN
jgi:mono/diheme cytochrome c family protein